MLGDDCMCLYVSDYQQINTLGSFTVPAENEIIYFMSWTLASTWFCKCMELNNPGTKLGQYPCFPISSSQAAAGQRAFSALIMSSVLKGLARALANTAWRGSDTASQAFLPTDLTTRADSCQVLLSSNGIFQRFLLKLLPLTVTEQALLSRSVVLCISHVFTSPPL